MTTNQNTAGAPPAENHPRTAGSPSSTPQRIASTCAAVTLGLLFLASGLWKMLDLDGAAERMVQSLVPVDFSMAAALLVASAETLAAFLLLIPRHRRWGAWLSAILLIAFMAYVGLLYDRLLGEDCNCFPWIRRVVGPAFFAGDAAMLGLAWMAGWRSAPAFEMRRAASVLAVVLAVAGGAFAISAVRREHIEVPATIRADGRTVPLRTGKVLLYFFDPECSHCYTVASVMATRDWGATRVVVVPTREAQFARNFLEVTKLKAGISEDATTLRTVFEFTDPPYSVAIGEGTVTASFNSGQMEGDQWFTTLQKSGHIR